MALVAKQCTGCGLMLELMFYSRNSRARDGLQSRCRLCTREKAQEYYRRNGEKSKARERAKYAANKDKAKIKNAIYYKLHKAEIAARARAKYVADKRADQAE